jgi:hypothetical protein
MLPRGKFVFLRTHYSRQKIERPKLSQLLRHTAFWRNKQKPDDG